MALGVNRSGRPCEWPKPGRSTATSRPVGARIGQTRRNANRLSGHGLVSTMTGPLVGGPGVGVADLQVVHEHVFRLHGPILAAVRAQAVSAR